MKVHFYDLGTSRAHTFNPKAVLIKARHNNGTNSFFPGQIYQQLTISIIVLCVMCDV